VKTFGLGDKKIGGNRVKSQEIRKRKRKLNLKYKKIK
jgi:hypothetical protein